MSRNKALTVLQKTYDDSYLSCSTAVYHESQGNELEAMRHWRNALDQIYEHNANKALPVYAPRTDTEKALIDALKELELQCKERIDLLEALRVSRQETAPISPPGPTNGKLTKTHDNPQAGGPSRGSIGQGTIPAVTYSELSRPTRPPTKPPRPSLPLRSTSDVPSGSRPSPSTSTNTSLSVPSASSRRLSSPDRKSSQDVPSLRGPSPDKYTMRTTLRSGKPGEKPSKASRKTSKPAGEGPSKAATLAWSALGSREKASRAVTTEKLSSPQYSGPRHSAEQPRRPQLQWDSHSRRLVTARDIDTLSHGKNPLETRHSDEYLGPSNASISAASSALNSTSAIDHISSDQSMSRTERSALSRTAPPSAPSRVPRTDHGHDHEAMDDCGAFPGRPAIGTAAKQKGIVRRPVQSPRTPQTQPEQQVSRVHRRGRQSSSQLSTFSSSEDGDDERKLRVSLKGKQVQVEDSEDLEHSENAHSEEEEEANESSAWKKKKDGILTNLPAGIDDTAAKQILNDIVVQGDEVRWSDVAGLEVAKNALREAVVYPFLRPDLFMGLREPARGMLLFGPPGTGKTMLARAVATESRSTFFSISASSLTSKFLGESEKLVKALFGLAKVLAPSIIFVDEIDSLLSQRSGSGEHEATRRIKTEFLIQWSDLQRAAAGRETTERDRERGDANRVLVLAATNLPWAIDEAARRRFVRRQYIPLPESSTRETQLRTLLAQQKHDLSDADIDRLIELTDGFSGSDITALAKDAAMGPLRSLGDALLEMTMDDIRPILLIDFEASLRSIRPSVSKAGLKEYEDWAKEFGERGG